MMMMPISVIITGNHICDDDNDDDHDHDYDHDDDHDGGKHFHGSVSLPKQLQVDF